MICAAVYTDDEGSERTVQVVGFTTTRRGGTERGYDWRGESWGPDDLITLAIIVDCGAFASVPLYRINQRYNKESKSAPPRRARTIREPVEITR